MMNRQEQIEIIAEYYKSLREFTKSDTYSGEGRTVFTADDNSWLVIEATDRNTLQARITDGSGVIQSWDDYTVNNADIRLAQSVRLSVSGRNQIAFTPREAQVIDHYGDYDRKTTQGKLDILSGHFKDPDIEVAAKSLVDKLGRISDQSYTDMYSVGQKRQEVDKGRSIHILLRDMKAKADKHNAEREKPERTKGRGIVR